MRSSVQQRDYGVRNGVVDAIVIDEAEQAIRFFDEGTDIGATSLVGPAAQFHIGSNEILAAKIGIDPPQLFAFDKETGIATHSYVLPEGAAATTWRCELADGTAGS